MTSAEIIAAIRRGVRRPSPMDLDDADVTAVVLRGVVTLGLKINEGDPSFFNKRVSLASNTHIFDWPSDCMSILKVWDLGTTAKTITGAADNGSGLIQITSASHGFEDDDIILIHDVAGCTEANGDWKVVNSATNTFDLTGSAFSNTYTSGGKAFEVPSDPDEINKTELVNATGSDDSKWYPREKQIVVDDSGFTNDLLVDYTGRPDAIADIPSEYHEGLVSFGVINLIEFPNSDDPAYSDFSKSLKYHEKMWGLVLSQVDTAFSASAEPEFIEDTWQYEVS